MRAAFVPVAGGGRVSTILVHLLDVDDQVAHDDGAQRLLEAVQRMGSVAEFDLDGTLLQANTPS